LKFASEISVFDAWYLWWGPIGGGVCGDCDFPNLFFTANWHLFRLWYVYSLRWKCIRFDGNLSFCCCHRHHHHHQWIYKSVWNIWILSFPACLSLPTLPHQPKWCVYAPSSVAVVVSTSFVTYVPFDSTWRNQSLMSGNNFEFICDNRFVQSVGIAHRVCEFIVCTKIGASNDVGDCFMFRKIRFWSVNH
jgi:hypothetical protein